MIQAMSCAVCLALFLTSGLFAQGKVTKLRGTVHDSATKEPVPRATVTASGDTARQSELTDDQGFFRILIEGIAPGDLVRIRVEKAAYEAYDLQVVASEEIPLDIELRPLRRLPAAPPHAARESAAPTDPVVNHYIQQMKDPHPFTQLNALRVLAQNARTNNAAMSAVIAAALALDYRVKIAAINDIRSLKPRSKIAVTNLIIALNDQNSQVRKASIDALRAFPQDKDAASALFRQHKDATDALFRLLGAPPKINLDAMDSLIAAGIENPRLFEAEFFETTIGNRNAIAALIKQAPLPQETINRLMFALAKSLEGRYNHLSQGMIEVLLQGGGDSGRQAMHQYLAGADPFHQSRLALSWLEIDHEAKAEILQSIDVPRVSDELLKAMGSNAGENTALLYFQGLKPNSDSDALYIECENGVALRAAMGVVLLGLPRREQAWAILRSRAAHYKFICTPYAEAVIGWLNPPHPQ
jgi:hypothetical protein